MLLNDVVVVHSVIHNICILNIHTHTHHKQQQQQWHGAEVCIIKSTDKCALFSLFFLLHSIRSVFVLMCDRLFFRVSNFYFLEELE